MTDRWRLALRQRLAAVLIMVLTLAGISQGLATASGFAGVSSILPGVIAPICHAGRGDRPNREDSSTHACCDACALLAPAMPADGPQLSGLPPAIHLAQGAIPDVAAPAVGRLRTPRQAQGPPAA